MAATKTNGRYMNLLNDFGFKRVFGKKENLIHFLNELFQGKEQIKDIEYIPPEQLGTKQEERIAIFDIYCQNEQGEYILLEMQNIPQTHFAERLMYYSAVSIVTQAAKGKWDYAWKSVYLIGVLNFIPKELKADEAYIEYIGLMNKRTKEDFLNKQHFIFVVLPKFNKKLHELAGYLDYWLYVLKHSGKLESQPAVIRGEVFDELFEDIEINKLTSEDMEQYGKSGIRFADYPIFTAYGREEGIIEGEKRGIEKGERKGFYEVARKALREGLPIDMISKLTGLTPRQIRRLNGSELRE